MMLGMVSGFGDMSGLLKQAQEMQKRIQEAQSALSERLVEGSAGGGAVKAVMNGNQELQSLKIDRRIVDANDVSGLEAAVLIAVRKALSAAKELRDSEMSKVTGGLNLPGMLPGSGY